MSINEDQFYIRLGRTKFLHCYQSLCETFPIAGHSQRGPSRDEIVRALKTLGRELKRDPRDGSFTRSDLIRECEITSGFVFQRHGLLECYFFWKSPVPSLASHFSGIGYELRSRLKVPQSDPPYPRPAYVGVSRLGEMLTGWDELDRISRGACGMRGAQQ